MRLPFSGSASSPILGSRWRTARRSVGRGEAVQHNNCYVVEAVERDGPATAPPGAVGWPLDWSRDGA